MAETKALNFKVRGFLFELRDLDGRLCLRAPHLAGYGAISADWGSEDVRRRIKGGKKQLGDHVIVYDDMARAIEVAKADDKLLLYNFTGFN